MKTDIVVGAFVLVVCLSLQANALLEPALRIPIGRDKRNDAPCFLPDDIKTKCVSYECDRTSFKIRGDCSLFNCRNGRVLKKGPEDMTKTFPLCCPRMTCG